MHEEYDIFEVYSDGALVWRQVIHGEDKARNRLSELAAQRSNELLLMHLRTGAIIASTNPARASRSISLFAAA